MKKLFAMFLTLAMLLTLAACGGNQSGDTGGSSDAPPSAASTAKGPDEVDLKELAAGYDGEIKITVWGTWTSDTPRGGWLAEKGAEYASQFSNVTFEYVSQGNYAGVNEKLTQGAAAGDMPTLAYVEEAVVPGYNDLAMDMRDYVPSATIDNYMDGLMVSLKAEDGKVMAVPMSRSLVVLYVNATLLDQAGWKGSDIKTIDDMLACAKAVYEATGTPGFGIFWDSDCWVWESMVYAYGGSVLSDDGSEVVFGKDYDYVGAKYMEVVKQGLSEGWISQTYTGAQPDTDLKLQIQNGDVAMMLFSNNNFTEYQNTAKENGYDIELYVQPAGTTTSVVSGGGNWVMCNTATYEEAMLAGGWLDYIASDENVLDWSELCGAMMITKSAYNSDEAQAMFAANPNHLAVYDTMNYLHKRVNTPYWAEMYTYMADKLNQFALYPDQFDPKALVDDMAAKCEQIIKDNTW